MKLTESTHNKHFNSNQPQEWSMGLIFCYFVINIFELPISGYAHDKQQTRTYVVLPTQKRYM